MAVDSDEPIFFVVLRVATAGAPAFQLRKGEEGLSVFDPDRVAPPLSEDEILLEFRPGCFLLARTATQLADLGLILEAIPGDEALSERLRLAHCEVRPTATMSRNEFKKALRELEDL